MNRLSRLFTATIFAANILCNTAAAASPANPRGELVRRGDGVIVKGADSRCLSLEAIDNDIVRIWMKPSADFERKHDPALQSSTRTVIPFLVRSSESTWKLQTQNLTIDVDRSSMGVNIAGKGANQNIIQNFQIQPKSAGWTMSYRLRSNEHLLGLGQDNVNGGRLDRRGSRRDLWSGQQINSGNVTASYPIPFFLSTGPDGHAYGVFCDNTYHLKFDLGAKDRNQLTCDADGGEADFYIINGPTLKDVIRNYTRLTGRASLAPLWTLGYWQSKCAFWNWKEIDSATRQLTKRGFPYDVVVIDFNWPELLNDYVWDKRWYGPGYTPASKLEGYAKRGVKFVLSNSGPMVVKNSPTFASGWKAGVFATDGHGNPVEAGYYHGELLDFTSPAMTAWLRPQVDPLMKSGIVGWWLDLSEPEGEPSGTVYHGGSSAEIHNQYALLESRWYESAQLAVHPHQRPFILTRTGSAGIQRFHTAVWSGDIHSDFATLKAHVPEMLNSGLSGLALWTCDSGGFLNGFYKNDRYGAHARLYERWYQFAAFCPILRTHHVGTAMPFEFGEETERGCLHYDQLRYRLLPYIYTYAHEASQNGLPITRPLLLEYPRDPGSVTAKADEYLFGKDLLVAPVLQDQVKSRAVYFPPGKWIDWDTGRSYSGAHTWSVAAPQHRIPVEVRAGAIIPTAPVMSNTAQGRWDPLTLEVFPDGDSRFTLYADDGDTFAYRTGAYTLTRFSSSRHPGNFVFSIAESNKRYAPKAYLARFHLDQRPASVAFDGRRGMQAPLANTGQWTWDARSRVLTVKVLSGRTLRHVITADLGRAVKPA